MPQYEKPNIPPATPPTIDPDADPLEARELADDRGDSEDSGDVLASEKESEIDKERSAALTKQDKRDGAGEAELDSMRSETLLPPD